MDQPSGERKPEERRPKSPKNENAAKSGENNTYISGFPSQPPKDWSVREYYQADRAQKEEVIANLKKFGPGSQWDKNIQSKLTDHLLSDEEVMKKARDYKSPFLRRLDKSDEEKAISKVFYNTGWIAESEENKWSEIVNAARDDKKEILFDRYLQDEQLAKFKCNDIYYITDDTVLLANDFGISVDTLKSHKVSDKEALKAIDKTGEGPDELGSIDSN